LYSTKNAQRLIQTKMATNLTSAALFTNVQSSPKSKPQAIYVYDIKNGLHIKTALFYEYVVQT